MHFCCLSLCCILPWMPNTIRRRPSLLHHRLWLRLPFATTWLSGRRSKSNYYHIPFIYPQKQHTNTSALVVDRLKGSEAFLERKFEFKLQEVYLFSFHTSPQIKNVLTLGLVHTDIKFPIFPPPSSVISNLQFYIHSTRKHVVEEGQGEEVCHQCHLRE